MTQPVMTEFDLQEAIIELAHLRGWMVAHFRPAKTARGWRTPVAADGAGFPDLILVREGEKLFIECKSARGELSPEQKHWAAALATLVMRPQQWTDGTIEGLLE